MVADGDSIVLRVSRHPSGYLLIPCRVSPPYTFELLLNTGRPLSYLSYELRGVLAALNLIDEIGPNRYRVRGVSMGGRPAPEIVAAVSVGPRLLGFEGMLGLHFLYQFRRIAFDRDASLLTLTP